VEDILATSYPGYDLVTRFNDIDHQHDSSISSDDDQDSDDENDSGIKKSCIRKSREIVTCNFIEMVLSAIHVVV
jgi:hypothetical protein